MTILICEQCEEELTHCDYCNTEFEEEEYILCTADGEHFCDSECYVDSKRFEVDEVQVIRKNKK